MMSFSSKIKIIIQNLFKSMYKLFGILLLLYVCKKITSQKGGTHMRTQVDAVIRVRRIKIGLTPHQWDQLTTDEQAERWASCVNDFIRDSLRVETIRPKRFQPDLATPSAQITSSLNGCILLFHILGVFEKEDPIRKEVEPNDA